MEWHVARAREAEIRRLVAREQVLREAHEAEYRKKGRGL